MNIEGGLNLVLGIMAELEYQKLKDAERPLYERPAESTEALNIGRDLAGQTRLPGQSTMEERLGTTTAMGVRDMIGGADSSSAILGNLAKLYEQEQTGFQNLGMASATNRLMNQRSFQDLLMQNAAFSDKEWMLNFYDPYQEQMRAARALRQTSKDHLQASATTSDEAIGDMIGTWMGTEMMGS
jgi:hypothetical protein